MPAKPYPLEDKTLELFCPRLSNSFPKTEWPWEYVYTLEGSMLQSPASTPIIPTLAIPEQWEGP